ncbi:hypothetical protein ACQKLX_07260 [Bosea sp. NPDC003192]|uniref:hypothetical protein n=1 Tax=Bosea sp. NPDC003192 TaxID=3390551 RepID=UPI003CFE5FA8
MSAFFSAILGASLTLLANTLLRMWQYRRDVWVQRVEKLCDLVDKAADLSAPYWLEEERHDTISARPTDRVRREAQILGLDIRILGYLDTLQPRLGPRCGSTVSEAAANFHEALTGGSFQSRTAEVDEERSRRVETTAGELLVSLRSAVDEATSVTGTIAHGRRTLLPALKKLQVRAQNAGGWIAVKGKAAMSRLSTANSQKGSDR